MSGNNAYSLISMSGTMLTTIHDGYWNADKATISDIANTWAQATVQNGVACCDCSCGNIAMMQWAVQYVNPDILAQLLPKLYEATKNPVFKNNTQSAQPPEAEPNQNQNEASSQNPVKGSTSSSTIATNSSSTTTQTTAQNGNNAQGDAFSNVGAGAESVEAGSSNSEGADVKKSVEINPITSQSASEVGLSIVAVLAILCLIMVVAVGYFRNEDDKDKVQDLDKLFKEKK